MTESLEKNLEKIEENRKLLQTVMANIDKYNTSKSKDKVDEIIYKANLDKRDNLAISLNYLQNQAIIEQNSEIIKYLRVLNK
jgi:hypothetical protein